MIVYKRSMFVRSMASNRRGGYVLITTLLIIAMAGIVAASVASKSMSLAVAALKAEEELQYRWGTVSCQRVAFSQELETSSGTSSASPELPELATSSCVIFLNGQVFDVRLDDESSKLDVNVLYENSNFSNTVSVVRKLKRVSGLRAKLRPLSSGRSRKTNEDAFEAWGQVFQSSGAIEDFPIALKEASKSLTCWSHRLNYRNCSDKVLFESAKPIAGAVTAKKLVANRRSGILTAEMAIEQTQAVGDKQALLKKLLFDSSSARSVWISSTSSNQHRHTLTVRELVTGTITRYYSWSW